MDQFNVLSTFDGMSCLRIVLDKLRIPITNYFASEIDKYAIQVSKANWNDVQHIGAVTKVKAIDLPRIDLLAGGSPCQGFSFAGKQLNFEDSRSKLFFEFVRLLKEIKLKNPNVWFFLENVVMKKEYQAVISEALGVQPILINSALVCAQNRKRLYWTNIPFMGQPEDRGILLKHILETEGNGFVINRGERGERGEKAMCLDANYFKGVDNHGQRTMIQVGNIYPSKGIAGLIYSEEGKSPSLRATTGGNNMPKVQQINPSKLAAGKQPYMQDRVYHTDHKSIAVTAEYASRLKVGTSMKDYRKLTPVECERLQGVNDNYTNAVSDSQRYRMLGNGWQIDTIEHLLEPLKYVL